MPAGTQHDPWNLTSAAARRTGYRGRFGMYLPPLLEALGLAELTHDARSNSMRGI